jgi:predicted RNase H-like HicB family nuclease
VKQVRVTYHYEDDTWWADSPDVDGYVAAGDTLEATRELVLEGLPFFLDEEVEVLETPITLPWLRLITVGGALLPMSTLAEAATWAKAAPVRLTKTVGHLAASYSTNTLGRQSLDEAVRA